MKILGYGEDSLTFWALKYRLKDILKKLNDKTPSSKCTIFYRPSFGRGNYICFGEFDAILATEKFIYLIESKWEESSGVNSKEINLKSFIL